MSDKSILPQDSLFYCFHIQNKEYDKGFFKHDVFVVTNSKFRDIQIF
jgi:hypothetical protein